ncbi:hypothetical protein B0H13DRAFT_1899095 [Mycena leptocephala]|nr:hypothetical protein B0H13DRAFT_1899095 [Mycena leptocephala]
MPRASLPPPTSTSLPASLPFPRQKEQPMAPMRLLLLPRTCRVLPSAVEYYQALALKLKAQRNEARAQCEGADAHAVMAGHHIQSLQQKLNAKGKKRAGNERTLSTTARILTSAEGRALAEEKRTAQVQKKSKDDENRTQRLLADAEVIKRRAELGREGMVFSGNIKALKAPQLKDLAWSLELEETGTRDVLIDIILKHFDVPENQRLKEDKRYVDLWNRRRRRAAGSDAPEQPEDMLIDRQNVASSSGSSNQPDFDMRPPTPPNAPYQFPDTWMPPQPHVRYQYPIDHPPPFSPAFYSHTPSQLPARPPSFSPDFYQHSDSPARPPSFSPDFYQHSDSPARHFYDPPQEPQSFP